LEAQTPKPGFTYLEFGTRPAMPTCLAEPKKLWNPVGQQLAYFQFRFLPSASHLRVVVSRWALVSSRFASVIQSTY